MTTIYKICETKEWARVERDGTFRGSAVDFADGFIHFSTAQQVAATAARHFGGSARSSVPGSGPRDRTWETT